MDFIADVHIGNHAIGGGAKLTNINKRCRNTLSVLRQAVDHSSDTLMILGDLFDNLNPPPQMVAAVQDAISSSKKVYILKGNHDSASDEKGDHALGPLREVATIIDTPTVITEGNLELVCVPFQSGVTKDWLPDVLSNLKRDDSKSGTNIFLARKSPAMTRIIALHVGISDESTPSFLINARDSINANILFDIMQEYDIDKAFCGNWHDKSTWVRKDKTIFQVGALVPTGWDNPGLEGYGAIVKDTGDYTEIPGPRFLNIESLDELVTTNNSIYARMQTNKDFKTFSEQIQQLTVSGKLDFIQFRKNKKVAKEQAKQKASNALCADNIQTAVDRYLVDNEYSNVEEVKEKVKQYLK